MSQLPIDIMNVNTSLAEEYFRQNDFLFRSIGIDYSANTPVEKQFHDGYNKIMSVEYERVVEKLKKDEVDVTNVKLMNLKKYIEDNAELFSQIEYLLRKVPTSEVINYDIKLISQNILYHTYNEDSVAKAIPDCHNPLLLMMDTTPLAHLGCVVQTLRSCERVCIISGPKTAAACYLFTELCHKSGLTSINLVFVDDNEDFNKHRTIEWEWIGTLLNGCVGVITENADIDSVVDVLLETTVQYPWRVKHILVQESVYDLFKKALKWKTRDSAPTTSNELCSQSYKYKEKNILIDYTGTDCGRGITVEAYRTTKELLSLLTKSNYFFMTLWTNCLNESREITHHAGAAKVIWINDFGVFDGPPVTSQAIYNSVVWYRSGIIYQKDILKLKSVVKDLENQRKWLQIPYYERFDKINNVLCKYVSQENACLSDFQNLKQILKHCQSNVFMSLENGKVCEYSFTPDYACFNHKSNINLILIVKALLIGTLTVLSPDNCYKAFFLKLQDIGAPVLFRQDINTDFDEDEPMYGVKVIYSNYGTIFAN